MGNGRTLMFALASVSAVLCAVTGVVYLAHPNLSVAGQPQSVPGAPVGFWLGALGILGALGLAAAGWWQRLATGRSRILVLLVLAGVAGAFVAANAFALVAHAGGLSDVPVPFHWAAVASGGALYVFSLAEVARAVMAERQASS